VLTDQHSQNTSQIPSKTGRRQTWMNIHESLDTSNEGGGYADGEGAGVEEDKASVVVG
jgi:hypothetical protein